MSLRAAVVAFSAVALGVSVVQIGLGHDGGWVACAIYAALILVAVLLERRRYRPKLGSTQGEWRATGERFIDPTSGEPTEVFERLETGEREYRVTSR